jgi:phage tail-like protein
VAGPITSSGETKTAKRVDRFATFKFLVEVDSIVEAAFTECSGLEMTTDVFEYQEGGLNEYSHKLPGRIKLSNVTLKRGFVTSNELYKWYSEMKNNLLEGKKMAGRKVTIKLYSTAKQGELMSWSLVNAFPVKWVGPSFNSGEAAISIEALELAHHGIESS